MPFRDGEIICPNCDKKIDKQIIKDVIIKESELITQTSELKNNIQNILDEFAKMNKAEKELRNLSAILTELELLWEIDGDSKLLKLIKATSIIQENLPSTLKLEKLGPDIHYERNFTIKEGKNKKGILNIKYDNDLLKSSVTLDGIGENSFIINGIRVIEVLHFLESIYYKKSDIKP